MLKLRPAFLYDLFDNQSKMFVRTLEWKFWTDKLLSISMCEPGVVEIMLNWQFVLSFRQLQKQKGLLANEFRLKIYDNESCSVSLAM